MKTGPPPPGGGPVFSLWTAGLLLREPGACFLNKEVDTRLPIKYTGLVEHSHPVILSLPPGPPGRGAFLLVPQPAPQAGCPEREEPGAQDRVGPRSHDAPRNGLAADRHTALGYDDVEQERGGVQGQDAVFPARFGTGGARLQLPGE